MRRSLYFVCPTDCLEPVINGYFGDKNHYYTSLGNSVVFDMDTIGHLRQLILKHSIQEISFVLSINNPIIVDALENQNFADIRGLNDLYMELVKQKGHSEVLCGGHNRQFIILSYHLNKKIKEFQFVLESLGMNQIKVGGKIYSKEEHTFYKIYSDLVCTEFFSLN
ncbi:hypothetical protein [Flagellimonas sp.]|uniref:hypothetical protein n=1 Tax=Flagellimonas sp. TaxID=2058762 RepID=UPI003B528719